MGGSQSSTAVVRVQKHNIGEFVKMMHDSKDEGKDIYELFGLERYCEMNVSNMEKMRNAKNRLQRIYHPDKNMNKSTEEREMAALMSRKINDAVHILTSPDLKRRHDIQLRKLRKEEAVKDSCSWWVRWLGSIICTGAGVAMIVLGAGTMNPGLLIGGAALLGGGVSGGVKNISDPDCSMLEYGKAVGVGAVGGAIGGAIGFGAAPAIAAAAAAGKVGIAAGVGAAGAVANQLVRDGVDLAINKAGGVDAITDCRSNEQILCGENLIQYAAGAAIGAACGAAAQGVANAFIPNADTVADEIVVGAQGAANKNAVQRMGEAQNLVKGLLAAPGKGFMRITGEKLLENAAGHGVGLAGGFLVDAALRVYHGCQKGKTFLAALENGCYEAGKDVVISLPGIIVSIVAGSLLSAGCEKHVQKVKMAREKQILLNAINNEARPMNANGSEFPNAPQPAPGDKTISEDRIAFGRRGDEHVAERHLGSLEKATARAIANPNDAASLFPDRNAAEAAVQALGQDLVNNIHGIDFSTIPAQQQKFVDIHGHKWKKVQGLWTRNNVQIRKDMGRVVGVSAVANNQGVVEFFDCNFVHGAFDVAFDPQTGVAQLNLITAYPTPPPPPLLAPQPINGRPIRGDVLNAVDNFVQFHHEANARANIVRQVRFDDDHERNRERDARE